MDDSDSVTLTRAQLRNLDVMLAELTTLRDRVLELESQTAPHPVPQSAVREPQVSSPTHFSGNRAELRNFLSQVRLVIDVQQSRFQTERQKVLYAASFLRDSAYSWFQPFLEQSPAPDLLDDFDEFAKKLSAVYGDPDQTATAERDIRTLCQRSSVSAYAVDFQRLAAHLQWNDAALASQFYWGLSDVIKDELAQMDRPRDLSTLMATTIRIDTRQTERRLEQRNRTQSHRAPPPTQHFTLPSLPTSSTPASNYAPMDLDATTNSKRAPLTVDERERRRRNNLCMYCGGHGHFAANCSVRPTRRPTTGRVAATNSATDTLCQQLLQFIQSASATPAAPNSSSQNFPLAQGQ